MLPSTVARFAGAAALVASLAQAQSLPPLDIGVCYDDYNAGYIDLHFSVLAQTFTSVRTFKMYLQSPYYPYTVYSNPVDIAAKYNLKLVAGVGVNSLDKDVASIIDGTARNPTTITTVYVGNGELGSGAITAANLVSLLNSVRGRLQAAGIYVPVGTVQPDTAFAANPTVAAASDVVGLSISPFTSPDPLSISNPFAYVQKVWTAARDKFGWKVRLAEAGLPSRGAPLNGHTPDAAVQEAFFKNLTRWQALEQTPAPFYAQFIDNAYKPDFNVFMGLTAPDAAWKFNAAQYTGPNRDVEVGIDFAGQDLTSSPGTTPATCLSACWAADGCNAYTLAYGMCYLKTARNGTAANAAVTSARVLKCALESNL
ncbi:hypothetical protein As57867_024660, partial [Aphanomyces stellatus]